MSVPDPNKMRGTGGPTCRWLLFGFDDVPPYYLICFVTLGLHVRPCFRFVKRQCVVNASFDRIRAIAATTARSSSTHSI
jgi:hypothetical protein